MINILNKEQCCGCKACIQVCPKHCINFEYDNTGFGYPKVVNKQGCINCGLCERACPVLHVEDYSLPQDTLTYAAYHSREHDRLDSSSGGVFCALAEYVINKKGVVFGAAFDEQFNVRHCSAETVADLEKIKRSKYVQSDIGQCYQEAKSFLQDGRLVLFSGVPCQIAGLKRFLRKDFPNLILLDVVCHGVASPKVWRRYLEETKERLALENGLKSKDYIAIKNISFRDKRNSWRNFNISISYEINPSGTNEGKRARCFSKCIWEDDYMLSFLKNYSLRSSCFRCRFRNGKSRSDITLADFWGIENCVKDYNYCGEKGTSLVMIHNRRLTSIINKLPIAKVEVDFQNAIRGNSPVIKDVVPPLSRSLFFKYLNIGDLHFALKKAERLQAIYGKYLCFLKRVINRLKSYKKSWQR